MPINKGRVVRGSGGWGLRKRKKEHEDDKKIGSKKEKIGHSVENSTVKWGVFRIRKIGREKGKEGEVGGVRGGEGGSLRN